MKKVSWTILAACGLVLFIAAHLLVAWYGVELSRKIGGWFAWLAGGALMAVALYHVIQHIRGHGRSHVRGRRALDRGDVERGPHDGFLVNLGHGFVEITVLDTGVPPRFRLFFYDARRQARALPRNAIITVETVRPGGARQRFALRAQGEYLESELDVPEPREFTAIVQVSHGSHSHPPHEVQFSEVDRTRRGAVSGP
jgi:nickel/cobalt exporter